MREIKFRYWDRSRKTMVYDINPGVADESDRFIVMQYTGLKDKHGKEIYEGDIVKEESIYVSPEMTLKRYKTDDQIWVIKSLDDFFIEFGYAYDHIVEEEKKDFRTGKFFEIEVT